MSPINRSALMNPINLRIRHDRVVQDVDFRCGPAAIYIQYRRDMILAIQKQRPISDDDCVLFISKTRRHGFFVPGAIMRLTEQEILSGRFCCIRFSCPAGFSWLMLANYASDVGITLTNVKRFEQHMARIIRGVEKSLGLDHVVPMTLRHSDMKKRKEIEAVMNQPPLLESAEKPATRRQRRFPRNVDVNVVTRASNCQHCSMDIVMQDGKWLTFHVPNDRNRSECVALYNSAGEGSYGAHEPIEN